MKRLILCLALCMALVTPVLAEEAIQMTVWGSHADHALLASLIWEFKQANPDKVFDIALEAVEEPELWSRYQKDAGSVADVFAFASDQLSSLVSAGALLPVGLARDAVIAENTASSVYSATYGGVLYAYPMTEDNGYFLYYDASVLTGEDVQSLDAILAKADASGKKVFMDVANGWYLVSFFFGADCRLYIDEDGRQRSDFNSDAGVAAAEALRAFTEHPSFLTGNDATLVSGMGDTLCAGISGTWNASAIRRKLGENYRACKLPTFTLNGEQAQMGSFAGTKLIGVNALTKFPQEADALAAFLTDESAQILRYKVRAMGPSNVQAAAFKAVQEDVALMALKEQSPFAVSPNNVTGSFWGPAKAFGEAVMNRSDTDMRTLLNEFESSIRDQ